MARQFHNLVSGKIGPVVFYVRNGVGYARTQAWKVKQTKATKESAILFGKSRTIGRLLRGEVAALLPDLKNNAIKHGFDNAVLQWLRSENMDGRYEKLPYINGHEFNPESGLHGRFKKPFDVDFGQKEKIHLMIPEFHIPSDLSAPAHTTEVCWYVMATSCDLKNGEIYNSAERQIQMPFESGNVPKQHISFDFKIMKRSLTVVGVALRYVAFRKGKLAPVTDVAWQPTAIVGSCYYG